MEHEDFYEQMMDALDGELAAAEQLALESHLRACPPCMQEWQAIAAIDALFRRSPMFSPAAGFTQRTIARLPNRRVRMWAMGTIYVTVLLSGLLPILLLLLAAIFLVPVVQEPALVDSALQLLTKGGQLVGVVLGGLFNGLEMLVAEQPAVVGWLLVMAGVVFLWNGVYRQMLHQPAQQQSRV